MDFDIGSPEDISTTGHVIHIENSEPTVDRFGIGNQKANMFYPDVNSRLRINSHPSLTVLGFLSRIDVCQLMSHGCFMRNPWCGKFEHPSLDGYHLAVDQIILLMEMACTNCLFQFRVPK